MINIILQGRLGNHLFMYAVGRYLALKHGTNLRFFISEEDEKLGVIEHHLKRFNIAPVGLSTKFHKEKNDESSEFIKKLGKRFYQERTWKFNPQVLEFPNDITLYGLFQSESYFKSIERIIREELSFKPADYGERWQRIKADIEGHQSVSIHVRRGDYVNLPIHNICTPTYFSKAIGYIKSKVEDPKFYVFSDDVTWCAQQPEFRDFTIVDIPGASDNAVIDLQLMTLCKHHINSNSTYSWWGAWLNSNVDKIVTVPERWFNNPPLNKEAMQSTVLENWVKIPVE